MKTTQIYYLTILEVRSLKGVSSYQNQGTAQPHSLWRCHKRPCLFQLFQAACHASSFGPSSVCRPACKIFKAHSVSDPLLPRSPLLTLTFLPPSCKLLWLPWAHLDNPGYSPLLKIFDLRTSTSPFYHVRYIFTGSGHCGAVDHSVYYNN